MLETLQYWHDQLVDDNQWIQIKIWPAADSLVARRSHAVNLSKTPKEPTMASKLPKTVYVYNEKERDGTEFLMVTTDIEETATFDEKRSVGIYELKEVAQVKAEAVYHVTKR